MWTIKLDMNICQYTPCKKDAPHYVKYGNTIWNTATAQNSKNVLKLCLKLLILVHLLTACTYMSLPNAVFWLQQAGTCGPRANFRTINLIYTIIYSTSSHQATDAINNFVQDVYALNFMDKSP